MNGQIVEYPSREALMRKLAHLLADRLRALTALGAADLPWDKIAVTLTDERWVPVSSPRSNQRLLAETLFKGAAAAAEFAPLYGGTAEPKTGLGAVEATLRQIILPLDVAVLGMGADMHTASLFPGAVGLAEALAAAERHLLITGSDKRAALEKALSLNDPTKAPVLAVLNGAKVHYAE